MRKCFGTSVPAHACWGAPCHRTKHRRTSTPAPVHPRTPAPTGLDSNVTPGPVRTFRDNFDGWAVPEVRPGTGREREVPVARRPLVNLSFALNYAAGGRDVSGYRRLSLAVRVACALLLFGIVRRTFRLLTSTVVSWVNPMTRLTR